jgi:hypothetical protein
MEDLIATLKEADDLPEDQRIWLNRIEDLITQAKTNKDPVSLLLGIEQFMSELAEEMENVPQGPDTTFGNPSSDPTINVYQLRIELVNSSPSIWRRVLVPGYITLDVLHDVIQCAMGWEDDHLHCFTWKGIRFSTPFDEGDELLGLDEDESCVCLNELLRRARGSMRYEYDFGDCWDHKITVEKICKSDPRCQERALCLEGQMRCPPEDCGGLWGYYQMLKALKDPTHERHEEFLEWAEPFLDEEVFDLESANRRLARVSIPIPGKRSRAARAH